MFYLCMEGLVNIVLKFTRVKRIILLLLSLFSIFEAFAQPANDNCNNAIPLTNLENHCYNNENFNGATYDLADGPCNPNYTNPPNTWYRFTAIHTEVTISAANGPDRYKVTLVEFAPGQECNAVTFLACGLGTVNFANLVVGNEYYIIISRDPIVNTFTLCIDNSIPPIPANNEPCDAIVLNNGASNCGTNEFATSTFDINSLPCPPLSGSDVWYRFTVTAPNNTVTLSFSGVEIVGNGQVLLGQWSNGCSGTYTFQTPAYCGPLSTVVYSCLAPGTYYIMVSSGANNAGEFCITATQSGPPQGCAQNDLCTNAVVVATPPVNGNTCVSGCNTGACGESNLNYQGCRLDLQATVWHTFTTSGQSNLLYNLTVTGNNHTISLFTGSCSSLTPVILCQPAINSIVLAPNTTYYVAISTQYQGAGNYTFCLSTFENPSICSISTSVEVTGTSFGSPPNGPYQQGEIVSFCLNVENWDASQNNCQWLHGIVPLFGNGWDQSSFDPSGEPNMSLSGPDPRHMNEGYWDWFTGVIYNTIVNPATATRRIYTDQYGNIRICSIFEPGCDPNYPILNQGATLPGGWFVCRQAASQGPCPLNWGDGAGCGPNHGPWSVCFDLKAKEFDEEVICEDLEPDDVDCSVKFYTMADGETGSWSAFDCAGDIPAIHNAIVNCCTRPKGEENSDLICSGNSSNIFLSSNQNPVSYTWTVVVPPGVVGASAGSGSGIYQTLVNNTTITQRVIYLVTPTNEATECVGKPFEVYVDVLPKVNVDIDTDPEDKKGCASTPFELTATPSGGSGSGYTYLWSSGEPNDGPVINVLPGTPGKYTYFVTVTDGNGCTEVSQETVEIFPKIYAELEIESTEFCEEFAPKILNVATDPSTVVSRYDWVNPGPPTPQNRSFIAVKEGGYYSVTITDVNGCTGDDEIEIEVHPTPDIFVLTSPPDTLCVDIDMDDEFYVDFSLIWLDFSQDPTNSIWGGSAEPVLGGRVYPKALYDAYGPGSYEVKLTLESIYGCIDSISHTFEIIGPPNLSLLKPPAFCATANPYVLQAIPTGGTWSGPGVSNGIFNAQNAGPGNHTIFYEFFQSDCRAVDSMILTVNPPPSVVLQPVSPLCFGDPEIQLIANPGTGKWTGNGITDSLGIFDPVISGAGLHTVTYSYKEGVCTFPYNLNILVHPQMDATFSVDPLICLRNESTVRFQGIAPPNSIFTWVISDGIITANDNQGNITIRWNSSGIKNITLDLGIDNCVTPPFTRQVEVEQPLVTPLLSCDSLSTTGVYFTWLPVQTAVGYEVTYNGNTEIVNQPRYEVLNLQPGSMTDVTITVVAIGNGICGNSDPASITCTSLACPNVQLVAEDDDLDICKLPSGNNTQLKVNVTNSDGTGSGVWTGPGVNSSGLFNPDVAGVGTHLVTYTFTEQYCPYNANIIVRVHIPPIAEWVADKYLICLDDVAEIQFTGSIPRGGTPIWDFDGAEVLSGSGMGPYVLRWTTSGKKNISLKIIDNLCESELYTRTIEVEQPLEAPNITCESNPVSVRFYWDPVPNATGYLIIVNNGAPISLSAIDTSYLISGLNQGDRITITIYAEGTGVCGNSITVDFECEAKPCPPISVDIDPVSSICLKPNSAPVNLKLNITGSNQTGSGVWNGPGVDQNGVFDPKVAGAGVHLVQYRFSEEFCNYFASVQITVYPLPIANFNNAGPICKGESVEFVFNGQFVPGAVFQWSVDGGQIISGTGTNNITVRWATAGTKRVSLILTENGCPSEPFSRDIVVEEPLQAPIITCEPSTTEILFVWNQVSGAQQYEVSVNGGPVFVTTDLQRLIDGLTVGQQVTISVTPIGSGPCGNGPTTILTCEAEPCPIISVNIANIPFICLQSSTNIIDLQVSVTGEVNVGTGFWSGNGIINPITGLFDPKIAGVGIHEIIYQFREKGCNFYDTLLVDVRPQPLAAFDADSPLCVNQAGNIQFKGSAAGGEAYIWNLDGANILSGSGTGNLSVSWSSAGSKNVQLRVEENGCISNTEQRTIQVIAPLADPVIRCNSTLTSVSFAWDDILNNEGYLVSINGGTPFVWNSNRYDLPNMTTGDSVTIRVIAISTGPCGNSLPDELTCYAADCKDVVLSIVPLQPICLYPNATGIRLVANATNGYGGGTFSWSGIGITDPQQGTFNPLVAGLGSHEITVTYRESVCPYRATYTVEVVGIPTFQTDILSPECFGIHDGQINVFNFDNGTAPYQFSINGVNYNNNPSFNGLRPGAYQVYVKDLNGCISQQTVNLIQPERLTVDLGPDILVEAGDETLLTPIFNVPDNEITKYLWTGNGLDCFNCPEVKLILYDQSRIYIEVEDVRGCKAVDDINIVVRKKRRVYIPGAFSPNNDGINDFFTVFGAEEVEEISLLQVFDRWGEKLFTKSNLPPNVENEGWDGSFGGKSLNPGVFIYHARVKFKDGSTEDYHGDVTLLKN
jgi:gliding motility-associated-like protein